MKEALDNALEEMKRVDHLIFVSLKYTRTVDVFKNIISRIIDGVDYAIEAMLLNLEKDGKITEIPKQPIPRCKIVRENYGDDETIQEFMDFYLFLRKLNKAEFSREREFRRHVTMTVTIEDIPLEINIDIITDYYKKSKAFISYVNKMLSEKKE